MYERSIPPEARPAFCLDPPESTARAWCMFKDRVRWGTPERTKRSLLIGYDLLPLAGLSKCERSLAEKGIVASRCVMSTCRQSRCLAVAHRGKLQVDSCCWSTFYHGKAGEPLHQITGYSFSIACGWVAQRLETTARREAQTLATWRFTLSDYTVNRWTVKDKRRASTTRKLLAACAAVFQKHDYRVVPVIVNEYRELDAMKKLGA